MRKRACKDRGDNYARAVVRTGVGFWLPSPREVGATNACMGEVKVELPSGPDVPPHTPTAAPPAVVESGTHTFGSLPCLLLLLVLSLLL